MARIGSSAMRNGIDPGGGSAAEIEVDQTSFRLRHLLKRGKVRPCEDGIQKTAHLLKREYCRPEWNYFPL